MGVGIWKILFSMDVICTRSKIKINLCYKYNENCISHKLNKYMNQKLMKPERINFQRITQKKERNFWFTSFSPQSKIRKAVRISERNVNNDDDNMSGIRKQ
jgi:hypothetical protein